MVLVLNWKRFAAISTVVNSYHSLRCDYFCGVAVAETMFDDMTLVKYEELSIGEASKLKGAPFWVDTLREDYSEHKG